MNEATSLKEQRTAMVTAKNTLWFVTPAERKRIMEKDFVFVFGSNRKGIHGAGAALVAKEKYGAKPGLGKGRSGQSYALPTKATPQVRLTLPEIENHVKQFLAYARLYSGELFLVTRIGTGLAGYTDEDIAPMFRDAPDNCIIPEVWEVLNEAESGEGRRTRSEAEAAGSGDRSRPDGTGVGYQGRRAVWTQR